jgi:hypothetical protein
MPRAFRWTAPLAAAAVCIALPSSLAVAKPVPPPPPTSAPCVSLVATDSGKTINRFATGNARFNVTNCSSASLTVSTAFTSVSTAWSVIPIVPTPVPCAGPSGSGGSLTLKPGETRSVQFALPPTSCPVGPGGAILEVDAVARGTAATVLATATAFYSIALKN